MKSDVLRRESFPQQSAGGFHVSRNPGGEGFAHARMQPDHQGGDAREPGVEQHLALGGYCRICYFRIAAINTGHVRIEIKDYSLSRQQLQLPNRTVCRLGVTWSEACNEK